MDNEEGVNDMDELLTKSLEGNSLGVQDAVNAILSQKALDALSAMKVDVAQSIYGTYGSEDQEADMELDGSEESELEAETEIEAEVEDETDWEVPEDDDIGSEDLEDIFNELEDLTGDESDTEIEQEENPDE